MTNQEIYNKLGDIGTLTFIGVEMARIDGEVDQKEYAATDVLHLHKIKKKLDIILERENRINLANACFEFISHRTDLDLYGWQDVDIFKH